MAKVTPVEDRPPVCGATYAIPQEGLRILARLIARRIIAQDESGREVAEAEEGGVVLDGQGG